MPLDACRGDGRSAGQVATLVAERRPPLPGHQPLGDQSAPSERCRLHCSV